MFSKFNYVSLVLGSLWKGSSGVSGREISSSDFSDSVSESDSSLEFDFWAGVRFSVISFISADIPCWSGVYDSSCEHSGVATGFVLLGLFLLGVIVSFLMVVAVFAILFSNRSRRLQKGLRPLMCPRLILLPSPPWALPIYV